MTSFNFQLPGNKSEAWLRRQPNSTPVISQPGFGIPATFRSGIVELKARRQVNVELSYRSLKRKRKLLTTSSAMIVGGSRLLRADGRSINNQWYFVVVNSYGQWCRLFIFLVLISFWLMIFFFLVFSVDFLFGVCIGPVMNASSEIEIWWIHQFFVFQLVRARVAVRY